MAFGSPGGVPLTEHVPDPSGALRLHLHRDAHVWTWAAAVAIAAELRRDLQGAERTRLLVTGDALAVPVLQALARAPLDWARVDVGLTDERWLRPDDPDSQAASVRASLLRDHAAAARFETLTRAGRRIEDAVATANAHARHAPCVAVLAFNDDGHVGGLYPQARDLPRTLESTQAFAAVDPLIEGDAWSRRIALTPVGMAQAVNRVLLLRGARQRERLEAGRDPLLSALRQSAGPLLAHWCP